MSKAGLVDTTINKFLEEESPYIRTQKLFNDYWYIWTKTGLLEFICVMIKQKYAVPTLDIEKDYVSGEIPMGDDYVFDDSHTFFDAWDRKAEFHDELDGYIKNLRLPRLAFDSLFERIFYSMPLQVKEKWHGEDTNAIFVPLGLIKAKSYGEGTYTREEVLDIKRKIKSYLAGIKFKITPEINKKINAYTKTLLRNHRVIQSRALYVETIKEMKKYRKRLWVDYADDKDAPDKTGDKQISEKCATRISTKLNLDDFDSRNFRRLVGRLYKDFPILHQFVSSQ